MASSVRSGIPFRVSRDASETVAHLTVATAASLELVGSSRSLASSPLPRSGSAVSPSAFGLRVVGLSRAPSMVLIRLHRTFEGYPVARMSKTCGLRDLHFSFRDGEITLSIACGSRRRASARGTSEDVGLCRCARIRAPLLGFSKDAPPSRYESRVHSRTVSRPSARGCHPRARSVLAVPPGFDGFLRASRCRSVAPCTRSWGSARFELHRRGRLSTSLTISALPGTAPHTLQSFPLTDRRTASPRPLPSHRSSATTRAAPRSQGFSLSMSPLSRPALPPTDTRCSPGLRSPPRSSPNSPLSRTRHRRKRRPLDLPFPELFARSLAPLSEG